MLEAAQIDWTFGLHPVLWWIVVFVPTITVFLLLWVVLMNLTTWGFRRPGPESGRAKRRWGQRIVFERQIPVAGTPDLERFAQALSKWSLRRAPDSSDDTVVLTGGNEGPDGGRCVKLRVTDAIRRRYLLRERGLEHRYAEATEEMRKLLVGDLAAAPSAQ